LCFLCALKKEEAKEENVVKAGERGQLGMPVLQMELELSSNSKL